MSLTLICLNYNKLAIFLNLLVFVEDDIESIGFLPNQDSYEFFYIPKWIILELLKEFVSSY